MGLSRTLLPALLTCALLAPASPATAADVPSGRVKVGSLPRHAAPDLPYLDVRRQAVVDGGERVPLRGRTVGKVRQLHRNGDDGWVAASSNLNHTALYRVDPDGRLTQLVGDRENPSIEVDNGRVVQEVRPNGRTDLLAVVYDVASGDRVARIAGSWIDVHDYRDGLVWMTLQREQGSPERLVTWDPDTGEVLGQGRRGIDGIDLDRGSAWKFKGLRTVRVLPLGGDATWDPWTSHGSADVAPVFSPDGKQVVTYTRRKIGRDTAVYPGSLVIRDADTGSALRRFNGHAVGDETAAPGDEVVWEGNRRFVANFWGTPENGSLRQTQVRLTTSGGASRVAPYYSYPVKKLWVEQH